MKTGVKVLLIGCVVVLLLAIAAAAAVGWFIARNKDRFIERGQQSIAAGEEFGRSASESQCVQAGLNRYRRNQGFIGGVQESVWMNGCLETSTPEPDFCASVPREDALASTVAWRLARCQEYGLSSDSVCSNLFAVVQRYCYGDVRKGKTVADNP